MFGVLKNFIKSSCLRKIRDEADNFLLSLKGMDSDEIAALVIIATKVRHKLESQMQIDLIHPYTLMDEDSYIPMKLNRQIKAWQKNECFSASAGAMVWLHTLRLTQSPELRVLGKAIWVELSRGIKIINNKQEIIKKNSEMSIDGYYFIPDGFEVES